MEMEVLVETTHQIEYATRVLPSLFHTTPKDFLYYLSRDGNQFLRFYWDQAGATQTESDRYSPFGLNYDIRKPDPNTTIVLVSLPKPKMASEAYYAALIYRPLRTALFWGVSDATMVVTLELAEALPWKQTTILREWSSNLEGKFLADGPEPSFDNFYQAILALIHER
jgi:hypothetical protein